MMQFVHKKNYTSSYEFYLFCESEDCNKNGSLPGWLKFNSTEPKAKFHGQQEEVELLFVPELPRADNLALFFVIKSVAGIGKLSDASNRAEVILSLSIPITTTNNPIITDDRNNNKSATIGAIVGGVIVGLLLVLCISILFYFYVYKPRKASFKDNENPAPARPMNGTESTDSFRATNFRDRGSLRRVESFPVLLYTHDQLKDFKKKVDPPLYKPAIVPKPWMSMNVLSNSEPNKDGDCKSLGSSSTVPVADKNKSSDIEQLDDISHTSGASQPGKSVRF
ncbi:uncharacterized protein TNIN_158901 [Trichonephila inaurata madagascariensis]|uniref:Uncharacterized protein n=1 Tax=Trichonephila inaurata madagascariensis TaxID=2747483 RepID=A0A8X6YNJ3_9ARAC|nr:uncharacterized protein TNIN_158901 [Trichonephila inaurata madagascariensis]